MEFNDYIIYVDESGDHNLESSQKNRPVFALAFCIFRKSDYVNQTVPNFQHFKFEVFGHDNVILRGHDIKSQKKPFTFLKSRSKRDAFMEQLNDLIKGCGVTVIASVIRKDKLVNRYRKPHNPYDLALEFCMERAFLFLKRKRSVSSTVHMMVEMRGHVEDGELRKTFCKVNEKLHNIFAIQIVDKKTNTTGLQIADLVAGPIGQHVWRPDQPNRAWDVVEQLLDRDAQGNVKGWGLKVFP